MAKKRRPPVALPSTGSSPRLSVPNVEPTTAPEVIGAPALDAEHPEHAHHPEHALADHDRELTAGGVRRFTRRAAAARADTSLVTLVGDVVGFLTAVGVVVAVFGSSIASLRADIAARPPAVTAVLPGTVASAVAGLVLAAGVIGLLDRLGPVSATPPAAAWWLPLPAARRGLLRGELLRIGAVAVAAAMLVAFPVVVAGAATLTPLGLLLGVACAGLLAAGLTGLLTGLQGAGRNGRVSALAGAVTVLAVVVPAVLGSVAYAGSRVVGDPPGWVQYVLPSSWPVLVAGGAWPLLAVAGLVAVGGLVVGDRSLGLLKGGVLRAQGETAQYASASVLSLDTRGIGRALSRPGRPRRRSATFARVRTAGQAVVASDFAVLARSPWRWGQLVIGAALPVLVARTDGIGEVPALVAVAVVLGWGTAAVALGEPSRRAQAAPAADRMLPLGDREVVQARAVVPAATLALVCGVSALLIGLGSGGSLLGWLAIGVFCAPAWAGAAVRGGYRPELDWSGPVMASPAGAVPSGIGSTLVRGPDMGVLGTLPFVVALLLGEPTELLLSVQLIWGVAIAAFSVFTAHKRD